MSAALDLDRFTKVRTLMTGGATPGERYAAKTRAEALAKKAGISFASACARADAANPKPQGNPFGSAEGFASAFSDFMNRPEMQAQREASERLRKVKLRAVLKEYGSEEAVFHPSDRERGLEAACKPFVVVKETTGWRIGSLLGWDGGSKMPPKVWGAVATAYPMPRTVVGLWAEFAAWEKLADDRDAVAEHDAMPVWIRARCLVLENALDVVPASNLDDMLARQSWMEHLNGQGFSRDIHDDTKLLATIRRDLERLARERPGASVQPSAGAAVQNGRSTAAGRRRAILSMLDDPDTCGLSDREIGRRVGVSPTTVGSLRRKAKGPHP